MTYPHLALRMPSRDSNRLSVLIVDDNQDVADSTADLIGLYGYDVRTAYGAEAALDADPSDVIILELRLTVLNGWEVVRWMRARPAIKRPVFIAITTCSSKDDRRRSEQVGIDLHLVKPADPVVLKEVLERFDRVIN